MSFNHKNCKQPYIITFLLKQNLPFLLFLLVFPKHYSCPFFTGVAEKTQLLKLSVPATFMLVSLDEGPGPPIKYQYAELGKLYSVVSQLIRCCNVSSRMQSSISGKVECSIIYSTLKGMLGFCTKLKS